MHRKQNNSYYWLLFAGAVTVLGCGDEDDDTTSDPEPEVVEDGGTSDASMAAGQDAAVDAQAPKADAAVQTGTDAGTQPTPDASTPDASQTTDAGTLEPPAPSFERGKILAEDLNCASCHRNDYAGFSLYPNITPHPTNGIGSWSDIEIAAAITKGTGKDGVDLCSLMMQYQLTAEELADLIAFLRGIPAVDKAITGVCAG